MGIRYARTNPTTENDSGMVRMSNEETPVDANDHRRFFSSCPTEKSFPFFRIDSYHGFERKLVSGLDTIEI